MITDPRMKIEWFVGSPAVGGTSMFIFSYSSVK